VTGWPPPGVGRRVAWAVVRAVVRAVARTVPSRTTRLRVRVRVKWEWRRDVTLRLRRLCARGARAVRGRCVGGARRPAAAAPPPRGQRQKAAAEVADPD
jgi:hypothetical protein